MRIGKSGSSKASFSLVDSIVTSTRVHFAPVAGKVIQFQMAPRFLD
jgi:hypothetical protein